MISKSGQESIYSIGTFVHSFLETNCKFLVKLILVTMQCNIFIVSVVLFILQAHMYS